VVILCKTMQTNVNATCKCLRSGSEFKVTFWVQEPGDTKFPLSCGKCQLKVLSVGLCLYTAKIYHVRSEREINHG